MYMYVTGQLKVLRAFFHAALVKLVFLVLFSMQHNSLFVSSQAFCYRRLVYLRQDRERSHDVERYAVLL